MAEKPALRVLSADAPKTGLRQCAECHGAETGEAVEIALATAPAIGARVLRRDVKSDMIVVPIALMEELGKSHHVDPQSIVPLGAVEVGVAIRQGAREPDLSSRKSVIQALLAVDAVIYNTASSGLYVAQLIESLGIADAIEPRRVVVDTGAAVIDELLARTSADAIGFGHVTEIRRHEAQGVHLVGPLPEPIGRNTVYSAGILSGAARADAARAFIAFMISPAGKRIFAASGVL